MARNGGMQKRDTEPVLWLNCTMTMATSQVNIYFEPIVWGMEWFKETPWWHHGKARKGRPCSWTASKTWWNEKGPNCWLIRAILDDRWQPTRLCAPATPSTITNYFCCSVDPSSILLPTAATTPPCIFAILGRCRCCRWWPSSSWSHHCGNVVFACALSYAAIT